MGKEQKEEVLWWNVEKCCQGEGHVKTQWDSLCRWFYGNCWIHVGEYWVHARLDYWTWSQNCRNALLWHKSSTSECTNWDAVMAGGDKLSENLKPLLGLPFDGTTWWNKDLCTQKCMLARLWKNENIGS